MIPAPRRDLHQGLPATAASMQPEGQNATILAGEEGWPPTPKGLPTSAPTGQAHQGASRAKGHLTLLPAEPPLPWALPLTQESAWFEGSQSKALPCASAIQHGGREGDWPGPAFPSAHPSQSSTCFLKASPPARLRRQGALLSLHPAPVPTCTLTTSSSMRVYSFRLRAPD